MATPALAGGARENQNKRLTPAKLQADQDTLAAAQALSDYAPANAEYNQAKIAEQLAATSAAQEAERAAQTALETARDDANAAEWDLHNFALAVKEQIIAQYGSSSNQIQTTGLKKKSEYNAPKPKKKATA